MLELKRAHFLCFTVTMTSAPVAKHTNKYASAEQTQPTQKKVSIRNIVKSWFSSLVLCLLFMFFMHERLQANNYFLIEPLLYFDMKRCSLITFELFETRFQSVGMMLSPMGPAPQVTLFFWAKFYLNTPDFTWNGIYQWSVYHLGSPLKSGCPQAANTTCWPAH